MKNLILLLLTSIIAFAADQPSVKERRVVLELDGISTNQNLTTPTVAGVSNGSLLKQEAGGVEAAVPGVDFSEAAHFHTATDVTSGAFNSARLAVGSAATNRFLGFDSAGYPIWTNVLGGGTLAGTTTLKHQQKAIIAGNYTGTNWIVDVQAVKEQEGTLSESMTGITFTNIPTAADEVWTTYLKILGTDGARDIFIHNTNLRQIGTISSNNLSGEVSLVVQWTGSEDTISQIPDPWPALIDPDGDGKVSSLEFTDYKDFVYPSRVDGAGATIVTNDYTSGLWGLATYNGTADTNGNYAIFRIGTVPYDLDTGAAMTLKGLAIRVSATDTDAAEFTIGLWSPASSSSYTPTDFTSLSTFINFDSGTLTSPAANDIFYFSDVTLTGWAAALTAGRPFVIGIARRNGSNDDSVTIVSGTISYGRTQ